MSSSEELKKFRAAIASWGDGSSGSSYSQGREYDEDDDSELGKLRRGFAEFAQRQKAAGQQEAASSAISSFQKRVESYQKKYNNFISAWHSQDDSNYKGLTSEKASIIRRARELREQYGSNSRYFNAVISDMSGTNPTLIRQQYSKYGSKSEYDKGQRQASYARKYSGMDDEALSQAASRFDSESEEGQWLNQYQNYRGWYSKYGHYMDQADFREKSRYQTTANGKKLTGRDLASGVYADVNSGFDDPLYDAINGNEDARNYLSSKAIARGANFGPLAALVSGTTQNKSEVKQMTKDEVGVYNYIYATQGKDAAQKYVDEIQGELNARQAMEDKAKWAKEASENKALSSVFAIAMSPMKAVSYIGQLGDYGADGTIDQNASYNKFSYIPSTIQSAVAQDIAKSGKWGEVGSFAYQTGMSMANFLWNTAITGGSEALSLAIMGAQAAADTTISMKEAGMDDRRSFILGTVAGAAEILTEKVSLETLLNKKMLGKGAFTYLVKNILAEGSEEGASDFINWIADDLYDLFSGQSNSEWKRAVSEKGVKGAFADRAKQLGLDMLGGAISGGIMAGSSIGINDVVLNQNYKTDETFAPYRTGDTNTNMEAMRSLAGEALELDPENSVAKRAMKRLDKGKTLSGSTVVNLTNQNQQAMVEGDRAAIKAAAEQRLQDVGVTEHTSAMAEAITKRAFGEKLSVYEHALLANNIADMVSEELAQGRENWVRGTETELVELPEAQEQVQEKAKGEAPMVSQREQGAQETARPKLDTKFSYGENQDSTILKTADGAVDVQVSQIVDTKGGDLTVSLVGGKEVSAKDLSFRSYGEALLYSTVADMGVSTQQANEIIQDGEKSGMNLSHYALGVQEAYAYGKMGVPFQYVRGEGFASELTDTQRKIAYNYGAMAQIQEAAKAKPVKRNGVAYENAQVAAQWADDSKLNEQQRSAKQAAELLAAAGMDVHVFASTQDGKGNFVNRFGSANGVHFQNGEIWIDLNSGNRGQGVMAYTIAHEFTHHIEQISPAKFKTYAKALFEALGKNGVDVNEMVQRELEQIRTMPDYKGKNRSELYDIAYSETVAKASETILTDTDAAQKLSQKLRSQDKGLWEKIKDFFQDLAERLRTAYEGMDPDSRTGREAKETLRQVQELSDLWADAAADTILRTQAASNEDFSPAGEAVLTTADGEPVARSIGNGSLQLSTRTYEEGGRAAFEEFLKKSKLTAQEQADMLESMDEIYQICKEFKDKYAPFSTWSDAAVVRDTYGKPVFSVVTPNGDYKMNLDFSLVCKKRRALDAVLNEMAQRGIIDDFELGQKSIVKINELIRSYGFETACGLCFVDAKRFRQAAMADSFVSLYNELVMSMVPEDQRDKLNYFNFSGNSTRAHVENGVETWGNLKLDFTHLDQVMKEFGKNTVEAKTARYLKTHQAGRMLLQRGDFMSSSGFDAVKTQNQQILSLYNSKKGTGGPKAAFGDVQYMNEILSKTRWWTPAKAYAVGGVRVQSFSDYIPRMVFDYVQMIHDMSATKLPAHAYTKETLFVKQFGLTGVKINMSLIPAVAKGGIAAGLDANGNYVWAGESFNYDDAIEIQKAPGYSDNCGTIAVGVSDEHIRKLLADPNIRMVIPYHKSGINPIVAHMNKIAAFTNYTDYQTTKGRDGKALKSDFNFNDVLHKMGAKGDPVAVANQYLAWCDENGYTPKFEQFRGDPNYYKLLEDFTLFNEEGNYVAQKAVKPVFPNAESAFGSMKDLIQQGLEEDAIIEGRKESAISKIVDDIQENLPKTEAEIAEIEVNQASGDVESEYGQKNSAQAGEVHYSMRGYDKHQKDNWANSKKIVVYESEDQLRRFIEDAEKNIGLNRKVYFGMIPDDLGARILKETGVEVTGYNLTLRASEVKKIYSDHGDEKHENLRGQRAITEDDFVDIPKIIASPDSIQLSEKTYYDGKPAIEFVKTMNGRTTIVAYVSTKHNDLTVQTMYSGKNKEGLATVADEQASANTPEAHAGTTLFNNLTQTIEGSQVGNGTMLKSPRTVEDISFATYDQMEEHFGTTKNYDVAGYLLIDGEMLDFSGKHWGDPYSKSRQVDHRDIQEVLDGRGNNGVNAMVDMLGNRNIRLMPESGGINLAYKPNGLQTQELRGYINHFRGEVIVDIDAVGGDTIQSFRYGRGTSSSKILADISNYFDKGLVPEKQSSLRDFLYSRRFSDQTIYEREFRRIVKAYDAQANKNQTLLQALSAEAKEHKADNATWNKEFGRLLRLYEKSGKDLAKLEQNLDILEGRNAKLKAQAKEARLAELMAAGRERKAAERQFETEYKALEENLKAEYREKSRTAAQRNRDWTKAELMEQNQRYKGSRKRATERRDRTVVRKSIQKILSDLDKRMQHPVEGKYIPKSMKRTVAEVLASIDRSSGREGVAADRLAALSAQYAAMANDKSGGSYAFDGTVSEMLREAASIDVPLREMDMNQLTTVKNALKAMDHVIKEAVYVHGMKLQGIDPDVSAFDFSKEMIRETRSIDKSMTSVFHKFLLTQSRPELAFRLFGAYAKNSYWEASYKALNEAQRQSMNIQMDLGGIFNEIATAKEAATLFDTKNLVDIGLKDADGKVVPITRGMMDALYMHLQNEDNARHVARGGLTVPDMKAYYGGNTEDAYTSGHRRVYGVAQDVAALNEELYQIGKDLEEAQENGSDTSELEARQDSLKAEIEDANSQAEAYIVQMLDNIESQLSDFDRKVIRASQELYSRTQPYLNQATNTMYGFDKATVPNYFPIVTDKSFLGTQFDTISADFNLENAGFMKERTKGSNPILLSDIIDTNQKQIKRTAQYAAFAPTLRDFSKVFGSVLPGYGDSVQNVLGEKFGGSGRLYVEHLMADLNGGGMAYKDMTGLDVLLRKVRGNMAGATLSVNPRVALSQAASLPTAAAELGYGPVTKALGTSFTKTDLELVAKYSPLLWYRMQGNSTTELGDMRESTTFKGKAKNRTRWLTGWISSVDAWTVGRLWFASEYWVQDHMDLEKGSDAYYKAVAEKFNQVVERTQPNYSTMQRSDLLRSKNEIMRIFTMFTTQRNQNFNILYDAVLDYRYSRKSGNAADVKAARGKMARAVSSQMAAAATYVTMRLMVDALLHSMDAYRDDDDELTARSVFGEWLNQMGKSFAGTISLGSEIYDIVYSAATKEKYWGLSLSGLSSVGDATESLVDLLQSKPEARVKNFWATVKKLSVCFGIPLTNMEKIVKGLIAHVDDIRNSAFLSFESGVERSKKQNASRWYKAMEAGNDEKADKIAEEWDEKEEKTSYRSTVHDMWKKGQFNDVEAHRMLQELGLSASEAKSRLEYWKFRESTGYDWSESQYGKYNSQLKAAGISQAQYSQFLKDCKGKTKREEILKAIHKQNLTARQKDALYRATTLSESKIGEAPWH